MKENFFGLISRGLSEHRGEIFFIALAKQRLAKLENSNKNFEKI